MKIGDPRRRMIWKATGAPVNDLPLIENIMRNEIFHSTLDWPDRRQLVAAARRASALLNDDREFYELSHAHALAMFHQIPTTPN